MKCGLLGRHLAHSYSPEIHRYLGTYSYELFEREEDEVGDFLQNGDWDAINVTIPYKKTVIPYLQSLSETAERTGSVNTIVRRPDGTLYGDNTDVYGFTKLLMHIDIPVKGEKVLILGSGGAMTAVRDALHAAGAESVVISRSGPDNYENLDRHYDAALIINATPVGMYPENGKAPLDLTPFTNCKGVLDLIYNPARTALLLQAQALHMKAENGLLMLTAQAKRAAELFTGEVLPDTLSESICERLQKEMQNIILIGMPGCGKTVLGDLLSEKLGREVLHADHVLEKKLGTTIPVYFASHTEAEFRKEETEVLRALGKCSGKILSTGGGCVLRPENEALLRQNGRILWIRRDPEKLVIEGRPLSKGRDLGEMFREREPYYAKFADDVIDNNGPKEETLRAILEVIQ